MPTETPSSTTILGPFNPKSDLIEERVAALFYKQFKNADNAVDAAVRFAEQIGQVWPHVATIFEDQYTAAFYMLEVIKIQKDARVSAHNLRLAAGQVPKFSNRLKASW